MRETLITDFDLPFFNVHSNKQSNKLITKLENLGDHGISAEVCPNRRLNTDILSKLGTRFCSVTWHCPSKHISTNLDDIPAIYLAKQLHGQGFNVLLHLAGRNLEKHRALQILTRIKAIGVRNIFALRGDPPRINEGSNEIWDFPHAIDLIKFIRAYFGNYFSIGAAGYPEKHPEAKDLIEDIEYLKMKVDSGVDYIITQASYDYKAFENFSNICKSRGITVPIIPGIFIISSYKAITAMSDFCGIKISTDILSIVNKNKGNSKAVREFGIFQASEQIKSILGQGYNLFSGIHVFTLNDLKLLGEVMRRLGFYKMRIERPL